MTAGAQTQCDACGADCTDCEYALSRAQGAVMYLDSETALVCWPCARRAAALARAEQDRRDGAILDAEVSS